MTMLTDHEVIDDGGGGGGGGWNYYGGGYTIDEAISYTNTSSLTVSHDVRENFFYARVGELTGQQNFFDLTWIPTYGRYNGNGQNDAWVRWQAYHEVFGDGRALVPSAENAQYIRDMLAAYEARYPGSDPYGLKPIDAADRLGFEHDLASFGGAIRDVVNNLSYSIGQFGQFLLTGNLYSLASVPFIGALASVYHVATGIAGGIAEIGGGLVSAGSSLWGGFSGALSNLSSGNFSGALSSFVSGVSNAFSALGDALANAFRSLFPVVVDLDGDGVELLSVAHADLRLDLGGGEYRQSGWVGPDDGLVAYDANGNGVVDGYAEFGLTNFSPTASSDLEALAVFDTNGDGVFDAQDEAFDQFMIWRDLNGDGVCQDGEAMTFAAAGVRSIDLALNGATRSQAGNFVANTTTVTFVDGVVRAASDVAFASSGASDSARMLAVDVTSHTLGQGLEMVTIGTGVGSVSLNQDMLDEDTSQLVVAASVDGGTVFVTSDLSTTFLGGLGDDVFVGSNADSTYLGGGGNNVFVAGAGRDTYVVTEGAQGFDTVMDSAGADTFVLSGDFTFSLEDGDLLIHAVTGDYDMRVVDWQTRGDDDLFVLNGETIDLAPLVDRFDDPMVLSDLVVRHETDWLLAM